jgi:hypothetical protein
MRIWMCLMWLGMLRQTEVATPNADELLAKAIAYAKRYQAVLPSLMCDEAIVSAEVKKGVVKRQTKIDGTMREVRTDAGKDPFEESHQFTSFDGVPTVAGKKYYFPYFVRGGFANGLGFLSSDLAKCYMAAIEPMDDAAKVRITLTPRPGMEGVQDCEGAGIVTSRFVVLERSSGHVLHSERTIRPEYAKKAKEAYFAAVDYGPVQLGGQEVWVPIKVVSYDPKQEGRFEANYSNFHRFGGTMKIISGSEKPPAE